MHFIVEMWIYVIVRLCWEQCHSLISYSRIFWCIYGCSYNVLITLPLQVPYSSEGLKITTNIFQGKRTKPCSRRKGYHIGCCVVISLKIRWQRIVINTVTENVKTSKACISYSTFRVLVRWRYCLRGENIKNHYKQSSVFL